MVDSGVQTVPICVEWRGLIKRSGSCLSEVYDRLQFRILLILRFSN